MQKDTIVLILQNCIIGDAWACDGTYTAFASYSGNYNIHVFQKQLHLQKPANPDKKGVAGVTIKKSVLKKLKLGKKVKYQTSYGKTTDKKTVKVKK